MADDIRIRLADIADAEAMADLLNAIIAKGAPRPIAPPSTATG
ncbi:hypothetical protein [Phreatobacter oligotrophus]|uniref:Acetyltransferase (GNAT) family protein n=1 Tax=Phreatobacter oligotrophus TaxID=1122261 RepID=A0A2T4YY05_9HYPH|nr:hypothetical protein [Phreatobacter oligotrophus]PTM51392.1 hypothetical protein C8P69_11057 [Phreatobacter oligotrophus]